MDKTSKEALELHKKYQGKIAVYCKMPVNTPDDLTLAYTPGVAAACREVLKDPLTAYDYTSKGNMVAVVTDGTAVLGLGNIGPLAGLPVMEGKAVLIKRFAGVDAFPICLKTKSVEDLVHIVQMMEPTFGGIHLEDIKAPECFEVERQLIETLDIPVFHDDQHATAIAGVAGIINALKLVGKNMKTAKIVINGAGAAGLSLAKLLHKAGAEHIYQADINGAIYDGAPELNQYQMEVARLIGMEKKEQSLAELMKGADVFVGVSAPHVVTAEMVRTMNKDAIVFALANPTPEIMPDEAKAGGARVVATGRSDFPNQVNNLLAFPGIWRGALDSHARVINDDMKLTAAKAIAALVSDEELREDYIIPSAFDERVVPAVAKAVEEKAKELGVVKK